MSTGHGHTVDPVDPIGAGGESGDAVLLRRVRAGDETAYGELWARHVRSARRVAAGLVPAADVDDIVSEAFERTLAAIQAGNGPHTSFSSYVVRTMRARAATMYAKRSRVSLSENDEDLDMPVEDPDPFLGAPARSRVARAFRELPPRWQDALWVSVVEAEPPRRVAAQLGTSPNGVSAMVIRARRRLRANFIDLSAAESRNPLCSKAIAAPGRHAEHLDSCDHCGATLEGLAELDVRLNARGAGLAAMVAVWLDRLRASHGWARSTFTAAPTKAVTVVVALTTAAAALTPVVVHPTRHEPAAPTRPLAVATRDKSARVASDAEVRHVGPTPVAPSWSGRPAARPAPRPLARPVIPHRARRPAQPAARPAAARPASSTAHPVTPPEPYPRTNPAPAGPTDSGASVRAPRLLSLQVWSAVACGCAEVRVRAAHRPDVVRVETHQRGAADQVLVVHPGRPGVLHLAIPRSAASSAPMVVTVSVTRRRSQTLEATATVRHS